jgi:hypothetical protein
VEEGSYIQRSVLQKTSNKLHLTKNRKDSPWTKIKETIHMFNSESSKHHKHHLKEDRRSQPISIPGGFMR